MTEILFINPGAMHTVYQELGTSLSAIEPPSLAALFATYVRKKGAHAAILDAPALNLSPMQVAQWIEKEYNPTLVVMVVYGFQPSASTQNMMAAGETCREIKKRNPSLKILMTGTHIAALPQRTMEEEAVDFVCSGEGPQTIWGVYECLKNGSTQFDRVPSLLYRKGREIVATPKGPLLENLTEVMPGAAWDLLPMEKYRAHNWHCFENIDERQPYASLHTSLGCPYRCSFCCINAPFGGSSYRLWSPEAVISEIDLLVNRYGVKNIKFVDEMFVLNPRHVNSICDLLIERNYGLNIWAYARVDTVRDTFLDRLKRAGIRWLALGIESGSKHVRDGVEKGRFGAEDILRVVKNIQNAGINVIGNYIFGLPDDTNETMKETLDLALSANCEFANFYCAMAYPGSKLYTLAIEKGWDLPTEWIGYSQHAYETLPLRTDTLTAAEVLEFRDKAFHTYYSDPRYLSFIQNKFGKKVLMHIKEMNKIKLRRKIVENALVVETSF
ncbi:B12-binding domain-containing radical SAM protein [Simkania negevensis]|uniref:Radical SAM domain protein n=1 Tax=Simkania negevensis (strain ATCC VR-1471 / DSM 27360 / Z) TaxID=331113 RepID=F8L9K9_SIMNZ|nr:radical SAM protein [Simkania negevensis]CCB89546.1 radical SAM domain protein [Simkania negevensis Z]